MLEPYFIFDVVNPHINHPHILGDIGMHWVNTTLLVMSHENPMNCISYVYLDKYLIQPRLNYIHHHKP
jgi:hypothetical protein